MATDPELDSLIHSARATGYAEALADMMHEIGEIAKRKPPLDEALEGVVNHIDVLMRRNQSNGRS